MFSIDLTIFQSKEYLLENYLDRVDQIIKRSYFICRELEIKNGLNILDDMSSEQLTNKYGRICGFSYDGRPFVFVVTEGPIFYAVRLFIESLSHSQSEIRSLECERSKHANLTDVRTYIKERKFEIEYRHNPFNKFINDGLSLWNVAPVVERIYGETAVGQQYAFIITKGLWYAVRLFMDEEHKDKPLANTTFWNTPWIMKWEYKYATYETVKSDIIKYQQNLQNDAELKLLLNNPFVSIKATPIDCVVNPDKYLKPGDHIQSRLIEQTGLVHHDGIYIGNGEVIHVSAHADGIRHQLQTKKDSHARKGNLLGHFAFSSDSPITVVVYRLRYRKNEEIVQTAMHCYANRYGLGEYDLFRKNCQHFAALCAIDNSYWMPDGEQLFVNLVLKAAQIISAFTDNIYIC